MAERAFLKPGFGSVGVRRWGWRQDRCRGHAAGRGSAGSIDSMKGELIWVHPIGPFDAKPA